MLMTKHCSIRNVALASVLAAMQPLTAQSASESDRLEKLERAVEQLQKDLSQHVESLPPPHTPIGELLADESDEETKELN